MLCTLPIRQSVTCCVLECVFQPLYECNEIMRSKMRVIKSKMVQWEAKSGAEKKRSKMGKKEENLVKA